MKQVFLQMGGVASIRAVQISYDIIPVTFSSLAAFHQGKSMEGVHLWLLGPHFRGLPSTNHENLVLSNELRKVEISR